MKHGSPAKHHAIFTIIQTAILAELAGGIATVEFSSTLSSTARVRLEALGYTKVHFRNCDGAEGWPEHVPL